MGNPTTSAGDAQPVFLVDASGTLVPPPQDHVVPGNPQAVRICNGVAFLSPTTPADVQPVSGTFWPPTQPVSAAALPLPAGACQEHTGAATPHAVRLSDGAGFLRPTTPSDTQPVSGPLTDSQLRAAAVPVTGPFFQATQPISAAALPLPAGAAQEHATAASPQAVRLSDGAAFFKPTTPADTQPVSGTFWQATQPVQEARANTQGVTAVGAAGAGVTLTLPAPGVGLFHGIELLELTMYATAARTGAATPIMVTSTNLPGTPAWTLDSAQAIGTRVVVQWAPAHAIKSSVANTATTIVCPATPSVIWRVSAVYWIGA